MNKKVTIYRKRHIPDEIVKLKDDIILEYSKDLLITSWKCIHAREDIERGISAYFIDRGYKISKMYNADGSLVYWYCDIMDMSKGEKDDELIYEDMLLDVIVYPDGKVEVVDADEFACALDSDMISQKAAVKALKSMDSLLRIIYDGNFCELTRIVEEKE